MAHSANIVGNYIVVFGGYNSLTKQYSQANFNLLSLAGCTDYIVQRPRTLKMLQESLSGTSAALENPSKQKSREDKSRASKAMDEGGFDEIRGC